jgi:23S rRNA (guanosine2251-2'-O)-methyltransferase
MNRKESLSHAQKGGKKSLMLVLPNIRSAHNVGSLIRTADAMGVQAVYLCGYTPRMTDEFGRISKPQKEIKKTALGAENTVPIESKDTLKQVVRELQQKHMMIVGLEQHPQSISISSAEGMKRIHHILHKTDSTNLYAGIALVVGEEVSGMTPADIALMEYIIEIPMHGHKESMNVSVAGGIALHQLRQVIDMSVDTE